MNETREQLIDRMIHIYGFEADPVIQFATFCECPAVPDGVLETIVFYHEQLNLG